MGVNARVQKRRNQMKNVARSAAMSWYYVHLQHKTLGISMVRGQRATVSWTWYSRRISDKKRKESG